MIIDPARLSGRRGMRNNIDDNLISFINVIFLILIFFMIAGSIEKSYRFQIDPPTSISETPPLESAAILLLNREGEIALEDQLISLDELPTSLQRHGESGALSRIEVRADAAVDMKRLKQVLAKLNQAGITRVSLHSMTY